MQVLIDTTVWSLAFRRNVPATTATASLAKVSSPALQLLRDLVADGRATLIGAIRQELLSGIKHHDQFLKLSQAMAAFDDLILDRADYELAAEFFNNCRGKGVQGSNTDFLGYDNGERALPSSIPRRAIFTNLLPAEKTTLVSSFSNNWMATTKNNDLSLLNNSLQLSPLGVNTFGNS